MGPGLSQKDVALSTPSPYTTSMIKYELFFMNEYGFSWLKEEFVAESFEQMKEQAENWYRINKGLADLLTKQFKDEGEEYCELDPVVYVQVGGLINNLVVQQDVAHEIKSLFKQIVVAE